MATATDIGLRELDHRSNDGIDVRLLWDPHADRVTLAVHDERSDESLELAVEAADALAWRRVILWLRKKYPRCAVERVDERVERQGPRYR
jgi:hypothetical protein